MNSMQLDRTLYFQKKADQSSKHLCIGTELYKKHNVKRGLRNEDGTGVLVGLTEIGEVHGYILDEGEKTPDEGRLRYRGINVKDLVRGFQADGRFGFEETVYLLLFGSLPTASQLTDFQTILGESRNLPSGLAEEILLRQHSPDIMNKLGRIILGLYSYDDRAEDYSIPNLMRQSVEMIARFPAIIAYAYQSRQRLMGKSMFLHDPDPKLSTAENFLQMIRLDQAYTPIEAETLDLSLVLHAEHGGGNNSSFTVRVISSAYTDTYAALSAACGSLKGHRHGGANNRVMAMMADIQENVQNWEDETEVRSYLAKIIRGEAYDKTGLVYGMGHAIYTLSDPRAVLLRTKAQALAVEKGTQWYREFELYDRIARLTPEVFADVKKSNKVIAPNVDFYSGFVYKMMDIPAELYTPIFALSRVAGWSSHRVEELAGESRIIRPAYKNVLVKRSYLSLTERE